MEIRPAADGDVDGVLELLAASLGWRTDADFRSFYRWKHDENPFGPSARWVAVEEGRIVGFRAFLRWGLEREGRPLPAVRAVDTATAPEARGRGVFRELTMHGLDALAEDGVAFVFNTPNERSGSGYLSMGWRSIGRVRHRVRPSAIAGAWRVVRARGGDSSRWSEPSDVGEPATAVLAAPAIDALLASRPATGSVRTAASREYLHWRYAGAIPARVVPHPDGIESGVAFVRVRRRGAARIAILGDVLAAGGDRDLERALVRTVARSVDADATAALGRVAGVAEGFVPMGSRGPHLVARRVTDEPPAALSEWNFGYGDLELM